MPGIRVYGATATRRAPVWRSARTAASTVRGDPAVYATATGAPPQRARSIAAARTTSRWASGSAGVGTARTTGSPTLAPAARSRQARTSATSRSGPRGAAICTE